jgi:maltooligosyltrehalose trehalohydrolase
VVRGGGVNFRVWAPAAHSLSAHLEQGAGSPDTIELSSEGDGYYSGCAPAAAAGTLYRFQLNGEPHHYPDPASRFQPDGPHGTSAVVDPHEFEWTDADHPGVRIEGQILYEMHVGTFTREGTWRAAADQLGELALAGITVLEVMPIADFPGRFGWGYDGVGLFAPYWVYGHPDDVRHFINAAHSLGLSVILDVVYNHIGPDGNYLRFYSPDYFTSAHETDWGEAINFDGPNSGPVREFFLTNAAYWIGEFHFDGLRLDATQDIHDPGGNHSHRAQGGRQAFRHRHSGK